MIGKACIAGALALVLSSPQQAQSPPPTFVTSAYIEKITCIAETPDGPARIAGTGFKLADGRWVSANHVTRNMACEIDALPIRVTYSDELGDLSIFTVPGDTREGGYEADCGGYRDRTWYSAQGHAEGLPVIRSLPIMYAEAMAWLGQDRGWSVLIYNRVIPGQSGGPVIGQDGKVVGIVNAFNWALPISFSRELKRSVICEPSSARP